VYLRPKYRDSLKRWFSETGGGSGNIWDFQDYCGNERWLAWVYMLDANSGFLLCSNASPICPDSLCNESGFFKVGSDKSAGTPSFRNKKDKLKDQLDKAEKSSEMIQKAVGALAEFIEHKKQTLEERREAENKQTPQKKPRPSVLETMDEIERLATHSVKIANGDYSFSPNTKAALLESIRGEQKQKVRAAINQDSESD
jgi:hypothetical protein